MILITIMRVTNGPIPTMSIMLIAVAWVRVILLFKGVGMGKDNLNRDLGD
jgi:hypothetical protein